LINGSDKAEVVKKTIRWLLLVAVILYAITGFGITEFRTVENLTFGLLTKNVAFKIHEALWIPFAVLLAAHVLYSPILRLWRRFRTQGVTPVREN
jgi:cytochrome b subunit of formate dehydrogenase